MTLKVWWSSIEGQDEAWDWTRVLYAIIIPPRDEIVYIGKADGRTVRERWVRSAKRAFWDALERDRGSDRHRVIVGDIEAPREVRLTRELLADVESLLIMEMQPWGNIQAIHSRIPRPGMTLRCAREWPYPRSVFMDPG